jgi:hypothetical protein
MQMRDAMSLLLVALAPNIRNVYNASNVSRQSILSFNHKSTPIQQEQGSVNWTPRVVISD